MDWCPFNWYRSSGDINAGTMSWFNNLQTTIRFQSWDAPVSQPGCWAYPDMLEVGRVSGPKSWNRAHFGAWCIVSAPLVLGMELTQEILEPVIDVITNKEAIAVNQAWAGHPGSLVWEQNLPPPAPPPPGSPLYVAAMDCEPSDKAQIGWVKEADNSIRFKGSCLDASDASQIQVKTCDGTATQNFTFDGTNIKNRDSCLDVWYFSGPRVDLYSCNNGYNQQFTLGSDGTLKEASGVFGQANVEGGGKCLGVTAVKPGSGSTSDLLQLWAKPQGSGAVAVLVINTAQDQNTTAQIDFSKLNMTSGSVKARDIWEQSDLPGTQSGSMTIPVPAQDSVFLLLTPVN